MQTRHSNWALLVVTAVCTQAIARPKQYTLVELIEQAPLIVEGTVSSKVEHTATVSVDIVLKGEARLVSLTLEDVPTRVPETTGLRLSTREHVLLFLESPMRFFAADQSKVDLAGSAQLTELIRSYLSLVNGDSPRKPKEATVLLEACATYGELSPLERMFMLQVAASKILDISNVKVREFVQRGMADSDPAVRWEGFVAARRLDWVMEKKWEFWRGLSDPDRRVRAVCFDALREQASESYGFDPKISPEMQAQSLAAWEQWVAQASEKGQGNDP